MSAFATGKVIAGVAVALVIITGAIGSGFSPLAIPFMLWALLPYGVLLMLSRGITNVWTIRGAGAAALAVETGIRAAVFLFPRGSTAAIALVFSPALIGAVAMPIGAAAGWLFGRAFDRSGVLLRIPLSMVAVIALALTFIAFARPELFPTAVIERRAALSTVGDPRVVAGADTFERKAADDGDAWYLVDDLDAAPGDELAVVDHKGATLIDVTTMQSVRHVPFGGDPGRLWNWYSRLVRIRDGLAVVHTGGGYSDTELKSLDNTLLWRFRPDAELPPTSLMPGDLDGDGEVEFYASSTKSMTRLSIEGKEVWTQPATLAHLIGIAPRTDREPSWIVATRYASAVDVWNHDGERLAELKWPGTSVHGIIEWPSARAVLAGETSVRGLGLDGRTRFEVAVDPPLKLVQAVAWQPAPKSPRLLAFVSGGDRDLRRWRLRVLEPAASNEGVAGPGRVVYDEVFDQPPQLLVARRADSSETLFVRTRELTALLARVPLATAHR